MGFAAHDQKTPCLHAETIQGDRFHQAQSSDLFVLRVTPEPGEPRGAVRRRRWSSLPDRGAVLALVWGSKSEVGSRKSEVGSRKSEVGSRKSEVGSRKSEVGSRKSRLAVCRTLRLALASLRDGRHGCQCKKARRLVTPGLFEEPCLAVRGERHNRNGRMQSQLAPLSTANRMLSHSLQVVARKFVIANLACVGSLSLGAAR